MIKTKHNVDNVQSLYSGDERLDSLYQALHKEIYDRTQGQQIPVVSVLGILDLIHDDLVSECR